MQLSLLATVFAATASGSVLKARQANSFSVSNFSASCIPHSVMCSYAFAVITNPESTAPSGHPDPVQCGLMLQGPDYLPPVNLTGCSEGAPYSWAVAVNQDRSLQLSVTTPHDSHSNYTGVYDLPADELVVEQHGAVMTQRYTGPAAFEVPLGQPTRH
ncbi:hypothetical protein F5Y04DRAFT_195164 [Hypomontagnella monticulosa]|nr:hypothetical protein F5Y04DRAFT_195164 [Hypomontagnella monticulosa]